MLQMHGDRLFMTSDFLKFILVIMHDGDGVKAGRGSGQEIYNERIYAVVWPCVAK